MQSLEFSPPEDHLHWGTARPNEGLARLGSMRCGYPDKRVCAT